jgi:hypothetical protein
MSEIKTWHQRCMEHPDHQTGMVSDEMIRARMCEEIEELRAENERLRAGGCARDQKLTQHCAEAAAAHAEIERLRARVAVLETALRHYAEDEYNGHNGNGTCARAALEATQ